jgi:hypothetical protein
MFPEGWAYVGHCNLCDTPIVLSYVGGLKLKIDPVSVPHSDALVLRKYWDIILNLWPDYHTKYRLNTAEQPVRFYAIQWSAQGRPSKGRLYIQHKCRIKRKAKR